MMIDMMELLRWLWMKNRSLVTDEMDQCMEHLRGLLPEMVVHEYPSGSAAWTWEVPPRWVVRDAWIETLDGERVLSFSEHPLSLVSYSEPCDGVVPRDELMRHLHSVPERPDAFPFVFKYYQRDWGMCIPHARKLRMTDEAYRVRIDTAFEPGTLKVGEVVVPGRTDESIVLISNVCHPGQVNDSITGAVVAASIAERLRGTQPHYTHRILFLPETIGSLCWLSRDEALIPRIRCALFSEMLGGRGEHVVTHSYPGTDRIDRVAVHVMRQAGEPFREARFREVAPSDEKVFNGPGVGIPTINITRSPYPYPEYHTSDDDPSIIHGDRLEDSCGRIVEILEVLDSDFVPVRRFRGPAFLSRYGLWVDWRENWNLSMALDLVMLMMDGERSVFDITEAIYTEYGVDVAYREVRDFVVRMAEQGLVECTPDPLAGEQGQAA
jgi:aminopeptidase-like protein